MKRIFLIMLGLSSLIWAERFTRDVVTGVVTDSQTHLQWQDDYSDNAGNIKSTTWTDAIAYCEALPLDNGGWRLPNQKELISIVDYSIDDPAISPVFIKTSGSIYWSSTTSVNITDTAWIVSFYDGDTGEVGKTASYNVLCVRAEQ